MRDEDIFKQMKESHKQYSATSIVEGDFDWYKEGNMRDYAYVIQLVVLANFESLNSEFIKQELSQEERLVKLNKMAISQMKSLIENKRVLHLK